MNVGLRDGSVGGPPEIQVINPVHDALRAV